MLGVSDFEQGSSPLNLLKKTTIQIGDSYFEKSFGGSKVGSAEGFRRLKFPRLLMHFRKSSPYRRQSAISVITVLLTLAASSAVGSPMALCLNATNLGHAATGIDAAHAVCLDVVESAEIHEVDPTLIVAMAWVETRFDALAVSSCGAVGPLQVLPRYHCGGRDRCGYIEAIDAGVSLVDLLTERHGLRDGLRAYACGPTGMARAADACAFYADRVIDVASTLRRLSADD